MWCDKFVWGWRQGAVEAIFDVTFMATVDFTASTVSGTVVNQDDRLFRRPAIYAEITIIFNDFVLKPGERLVSFSV